MKNIDIIVELERYLKTDDKAILTQLLGGLNREYQLEELKKTGGTDAVKRQKAIEKLLKKNQKAYPNRNYDKLLIDNIGGKEMQVLFNGYYAIALKKDYFVTAPTTDDKSTFTNAGALFKRQGEYKDINFDIAEIKKDFARWKTEQKEKAKKERETACILPIGNIENIGFNAEYFISLHEVLSGADEVKFYQNQNAIGISYFESKVGIALLCPCKMQ